MDVPDLTDREKSYLRDVLEMNLITLNYNLAHYYYKVEEQLLMEESADVGRSVLAKLQCLISKD